MIEKKINKDEESKVEEVTDDFIFEYDEISISDIKKKKDVIISKRSILCIT